MTGNAAMGRRIQEARTARELSVGEAARLMSVTTKTFSNWESGRTGPRPNTLQILAGVLGAPLLWLIDGDPRLDPFVGEPDRIEILGSKMDRLAILQREVSELSSEIAEEIADIRSDDEPGPQGFAA